ncbi:hypothetical protein K469DRAFT_695839 [Zopfia rhizophila CBS 207.26]|uniref:Uncharacterized protein n=1 Tax=Zopfia rhizophila CBS 207.26 TaxID=1314779 RepID=A0A6A6EJ42_9PEZI|nr:hypothetical protein K469DRAFT_695839 [Zopfia rhizophila CBS 207.26]
MAVQSSKGRPKKQKGKGGSKEAPVSGLYISVFDFFLTTHNVTLKNPYLPLVNTGTRKTLVTFLRNATFSQGQFSMTVSPRLITVPGRSQRSCTNKQNKATAPRFSSWNMINIKFNTAATLKKGLPPHLLA